MAVASASAVLLVWACSDNPNPVRPGFDGGADSGGDADVLQKQGDFALKPNAENPIEECSRTIAASSTGVCGVTTTGTGTARIFQGTVLLPGKTLHKGEVVVDNGVITCAACDCSAATGYATGSIVSCASGVISPGLINTHDHLTYLKNRPTPHGTIRYESRQDWRKGNHGATPIAYSGSATTANLVVDGELRFLIGGATSTAGAGGHFGLLRNVDVLDPSTQQGAPMQAANSDTFPLDDTGGQQNTMGCTYGPSRTTAGTVSGVDSYLPHIAEGIDLEARNEFLCQSKDDKANGYFDLLAPQTAILHAIPLVAEDGDLLRENQTSVVWSPRTNVDLYGNTAPVTMLDAEGVMLALGTDWIISGSMNMLRELKCADGLNSSYFDKHFSDSDLWKMVTINAAYAVGAKHALGQLTPGYLADIAIFDGTTDKDHRAVLNAGVEDVVLVMRGGKALYGDTALMNDPVIGAAACEDMHSDVDAGTGDVCGHAKKACVASDVNDGATTLDSAVAYGNAYYPLFFCKGDVPTDEPSCVPYRDTYKDGITADDSDGDGIADADDNCPKIFNPVRLMDNTVQADSDGDGVGDACDRCPLDASNTCAKPDANDSDGDGVVNDEDNCPKLANGDQADSDNDGIGNACDACPTANPGATACVTTVQQVRNRSAAGHVRSGVEITLTDLYVTALLPNSGTSRGVFLQAGTDPWSGIVVNTGSKASGLVIGNKVTVTGYYFEDFNQSTINYPV
ncbi:MAG: amidohydrolase family protein, partial [Polyangiaceae bacterium]